MITPDEIRIKAERLYPKVLRAWLEGDTSFFPRTVPSSKSLDEIDNPSAIEAVQELRKCSKETLGHGYTVEWAYRRSRRFGRNAFPNRIIFESRDDLIRLVNRRQEFNDFSCAVTKLRSEFPTELESWFPSNVKLLMDHAATIDGVIAVLRYFLANPQPHLFARELPVDVDTKFIERHQRILRPLLDRTLPAHAIRADENQFERRFGLRDKEPFLILRCLDPAIQSELALPSLELALPLPVLATLRVKRTVLFVVENRITLRTFPAHPRGLALEGRGNAIADLRDVRWLTCNDVHYWGDIDVEGFNILSAFRMVLPHVRSFLMDLATLEIWSKCCTPGTNRDVKPPAHLRASERQAFDRCRTDNIRLEQERITQDAVVKALSGLAEGQVDGES